MIKISLTKQERLELNQVRNQASKKGSEKALMILMNADGKLAAEIAKTLKRAVQTVRDWLNRYKKKGVKGLERKYSPGRPPEKRDKAKERIEELFKNSPEAYGYCDTTWTVGLLMHDLENHFGEKISKETIARALHGLGYSYKRSRKKASTDRMSDEQKRIAFDEMLIKIKDLTEKKECEIYAMDESHFSTSPYLTRGWFLKKGLSGYRNA